VATSIIPPFRRLRQDGKFEASLDHIVKLCLKKNGKKKTAKVPSEKSECLRNATQGKGARHHAEAGPVLSGGDTPGRGPSLQNV
jgi:hypothetical protein